MFDKIFKNLLLPTLFWGSVICTSGQIKDSVDTICVENYNYYAPNSFSLEQAKREALNHARAEVLTRHYGTMIMQYSTLFTKEGKNDVYENFTSFLSSEEKGVWLGDVVEPDCKVTVDDDGFAITVSLCFIAQELTAGTTDLKIWLNGQK